MFDMRYHIVSLVAVFLALAIGIMLGSSIENRGVLKDQQERLVKSIEKDIANIKTKNTDLQSQLRAQKAFESEVSTALIKDRLEGKNIAVLYFKNAGSETLKRASLEALRKAGATAKDIGLDRKKILELKIENQEISTSESTKKYANLEQFSLELTSEPGALLAQLEQEGELKLSEDFFPVEAVVMFAGGNKPNLEEIALAKAFRKNKIKTVFIDKTDNKFSKISQFIEANIDTVDNIEMVYGRISLVYAILDSRRGNYGVKPSAKQLMPILSR